MGYRLTTADYASTGFRQAQPTSSAQRSNGDYYHYTYDAVGNRLTQTSSVLGLPSTVSYVYDDANRLTSVNGVTYTWDANGNLLNDGVNTYTYNAANQLKTLTGPSVTASYAYNGMGDRLQQVHNGQTTNFMMDYNTGLTQVLNDGTNNYIYGNGRIAQINTGTEYFLGDALGSVRQLTNNSGAITYASAYDPYGVTTQTHGAAQTAYGYTGEYTSNDLVYLRARHYAPGMGRFLTRDTWVGNVNRPLSLNRWAYVQGNPINYIDPSGHGPIHFQVVVRYAQLYGLMPEYVIPSTVPDTPSLWPGQRRGKRVDLADLVNFQIWEVEPYSASGNYPKGHGVEQVTKYLELLNVGNNQWMPGGYLGRQSFMVQGYDVNAWWQAPGLIVYEAKLNKTRALVIGLIFCYLTYERTKEAFQQGLRELPRYLPPIQEPNPAFPPPIIFPPPIPVPVFIF